MHSLIVSFPHKTIYSVKNISYCKILSVRVEFFPKTFPPLIDKYLYNMICKLHIKKHKIFDECKCLLLVIF